MRQVREHSPVGNRCSQNIGARRASILAGFVAAGITLLTAVTGFAQVQNPAGSTGGRGSAPPPVNYPIDEFGTAQAGSTAPMTPTSAQPAKSDKACCTPGKDCPCTAGRDCACTPGVNCPCTPGKDCACTPGVNCPARPPLRSDFCTPGKNCPCSGDSCRYCTPGKDCPCTPFINCPNDHGVIFEKNVSQLSDENRQKLSRAVEELKKLPDGEMIRIEGHTTPAEAGGSPPARLKLSQDRARAVEQALLQAGLPPGRLAPGGTRGWGGLCPQVLNPEDEKNRRVQFMFSVDVTLCAQAENQRRGANLPPYKKPPQKQTGVKQTGVKQTGSPQVGSQGATGPKPATAPTTVTKPATAPVMAPKPATAPAMAPKPATAPTTAPKPATAPTTAPKPAPTTQAKPPGMK